MALASARADKINTRTYEDYGRARAFPPLEQVLGLPQYWPAH